MGRQAIMLARSKCRLDDINMQILMILNTNGRITATELADRLHVSRPAVHRRIKRMGDLGIIKGFTVMIDWGLIEQDEEKENGI